MSEAQVRELIHSGVSPEAAHKLIDETVPEAVAESITAGTLLIILPTSDPQVAGALWNNAGTVTVSAG